MDSPLVDNSNAAEYSEAGASTPAPIYNLPNELLCMIIQEAYEHDPTQCYLETPSSLPNPLVISHVSQHMRDLAFTIPHIWNCIHVDFDNPSTLHRDKLLHLFARSSPLEISVHFRHLNAEPRDPRSHLMSQASPIWAHGGHLRHCTVITAYPPLLYPIIGLINMFPNLRSLHIEPAVSDLVLPDPGYKFVAPLLTSLRLRSMMFVAGCSLFSNLRELVLCDYSVSVHYLREVIRSSPLLVCLTLDSIAVETLDDDETDAELTHAIDFPSLRTLKMYRPWFCLEWLLARIVAPQLEFFEIAQRDHAVSTGFPPNWLTHTPCVHEVRVIADDMVINTIHDIRRLTPAVRTLDLSDTHADGFLEMITAPEPWMPLLSKLIVTRLDNHSLLMKLVVQRRDTEHPITEIQLGKPLEDELSAATREWLERFVDVKSAEPAVMPRYWLRPPDLGFMSGRQDEEEDEVGEEEGELE